MKRTLTILLLITLLCACDLFDDKDETFAIEGNVKFSQVEGGCWFVETEDETRYEPIDMPEEIREDGLFVRLIVRPRDDAVSICMIGRLVEIVRVVETSN
jgi:inhibitor of cysteine peptidase